MLIKQMTAGVVLMAGASAATAVADVAHWRFEGDLSSVHNSPALDASAGPTSQFIADVPGPVIVDGASGDTWSSELSYDDGAGSPASVSDHAILNDATGLGAFTIEAFIKLDGERDPDWDRILGNRDSGEGWVFGMDGDSGLRFTANQAGGAQPTRTLQSGEPLSTDVWHHVAVVSEFTDRSATSQSNFADLQLYVDYEPVGGSERYFSDGPGGSVFLLREGAYWLGREDQGIYVDQLRVSSSALSADQMLTAIPEPGSLLLLGAGGLLMLGGGRRRREP